MLPLKYRFAPRSQLPAGLVNQSYSLQLTDERCYLREGSVHAHLLGIDRYRELHILRQAVVAGWAPEVLYADPETGILVTPWLEQGSEPLSHWQAEAGLEVLAGLMAGIHALDMPNQGSNMNLDLESQVRFYLARICDRKAEQTMFANKALTLLPHITASCKVLCHNDVNPGNLLGQKPWLVDWEYAAFGDPAFDLAVLGRNFELSPPQLARILWHYQNRGGNCSMERVTAMLPVVDVINLLWLAVYRQCDKRLLLDAMYQSLLERMMTERGGW